MREADRRLGLIESVARRAGDECQNGRVRHQVVTLVRRRVMALCARWEGLKAGKTARDPVHRFLAGNLTWLHR